MRVKRDLYPAGTYLWMSWRKGEHPSEGVLLRTLEDPQRYIQRKAHWLHWQRVDLLGGVIQGWSRVCPLWIQREMWDPGPTITNRKPFAEPNAPEGYMPTTTKRRPTHMPLLWCPTLTLDTELAMTPDEYLEWRSTRLPSRAEMLFLEE